MYKNERMETSKKKKIDRKKNEMINAEETIHTENYALEKII